MFDTPLHRTNPKGQPDAGWMCENCIEKKEPELYSNLKSDGDFKVANDVINAINDDTDEDEFLCCDNCDLPDACADFGCAIKTGVRKTPLDFL